MSNIFIFTVTFLITFLFTDLLVRKLFLRLHESIRDYNYSYFGLSLIVFGILVTFLQYIGVIHQNIPTLMTVIYAWGHSIVAHQIMYRGLLLSQERESTVAQRC